MKKRTITNKGMNQPLVNQSGAILANVAVNLLLVRANRLPAFAIDVVTKECIVSGWTKLITDANGELEDDFWPTSRSAVPVFYLCQIPASGEVFMASLEDGDTPISWADFRLSAEVVNESLPTVSVAHIQDNIRHLLPDERAALSAAGPTAANRLATLSDLALSNGGLEVKDDAGITHTGQSIQFVGAIDGVVIPDLLQIVNVDGVIRIIVNFPFPVSGGQL